MTVGNASANASTPVTERTTIRIVNEIDWNVRSRQRATRSPIAPPATPDEAVTANRVSTCPNEIPPRSMQSAMSPVPAPSMARIFIRPASNFPSTISRSLRSVIRSMTKVRRSFSWATDAAVKIGAKNRIRVNWRTANIP